MYIYKQYKMSPWMVNSRTQLTAPAYVWRHSPMYVTVSVETGTYVATYVTVSTETVTYVGNRLRGDKHIRM